MRHPDNVLDFWFADSLESPAAARERTGFWFDSNAETDGRIWELFADSVTDAADGHYDEWSQTARGRLALIILLDQFPRNMYRGTGEAYRYDPLALSLAQAGVAVGQLAGLSVPEQAFFLMPYQHAEDLAVQQAGVDLMQAVVSEATEEWRDVARNFRDYAVRHHDIVEHYGRFPHRNSALGRHSTEAETRFLAEGGETFGQGG